MTIDTLLIKKGGGGIENFDGLIVFPQLQRENRHDIREDQ